MIDKKLLKKISNTQKNLSILSFFLWWVLYMMVLFIKNFKIIERKIKSYPIFTDREIDYKLNDILMEKKYVQYSKNLYELK